MPNVLYMYVFTQALGGLVTPSESPFHISGDLRQATDLKTIVVDAKILEPLAAGRRPLLWVACPTNRSGKTEYANHFVAENPDGLGSIVFLGG